MKRIPRRKLFLAILFVAVAAVLVILLVLIGLGYLVLPKSAPGSVTIESVQFTIQQGTISGGSGWFGPSTFSYGNNAGFPRSVTVGQAFELPWDPENFDTKSHTVYTVNVGNAGFCVAGAHPALPDSIPPGDDGGQFEFSISVPSSASGALNLLVTIDALNPGQQTYCS
jgi:hypothetical protein